MEVVGIVNYILRRIISLIPVLLVVGIIVFLVVNLIPGDPAAVMLGSDATIDEIETLRSKLGLDQPTIVQLVKWFGSAVRGNLGDSIYYSNPVLEIIIERLEPTLLLVFMSITIAIIIGLPVGIVAAINRNTFIDRFIMFWAMLGISTPAFFLGLSFILIFAVNLSIFPASGYVPINEGGIAKAIYYLLLPAFTLGFRRSVAVARITRSSMLDVLRNDYIQTARAKGISEMLVIGKHAFRNAIIPVITQIGLSLAHLMGGAIVTETIFNIPGIGQLAVASITRRDYPVIQAHVLFVAFAYVITNLVVDIFYRVFDPRIEYM